jgi:sialate O-acetylesterase
MVLQRGTPVQLWGMDTPGATVQVTVLGQQLKATADGTGTWSVMMPASPAATGNTIAIQSSTGDAITYSDVAWGDVFVGSGQSNMELQVLTG